MKIQVRKTGNQAEWESKVFDSGLLDVGFLDLVRKPSRSISWLWHHTNAAGKAVDTLGATLS